MVTIVINCSSILPPQQALIGKSSSTRREGVPLRETESEAQEAVEDELHTLLIWMDPVCDFSSPSFIHVENPDYVSMILLLEQVLISASDSVWLRSIWETTSGKSPGKRAPLSSLISLSSRCLLLRFCSFEVTSPTVSLSPRCLPQGLGFLWSEWIQLQCLSKE